jgi:ribosomal protein L20A (L18A)
MHSQQGPGLSAAILNTEAVRFKQVNQTPGGLDGSLGGFCYSVQKKGKPFLPVSVFANDFEKFVVFGPVFFEVQAQVEQWFTKNARAAKEQCYQHSAYSSIPIQEGVNRFKLNMEETCLHHKRKFIVFRVDESLQI